MYPLLLAGTRGHSGALWNQTPGTDIFGGNSPTCLTRNNALLGLLDCLLLLLGRPPDGFQKFVDLGIWFIRLVIHSYEISLAELYTDGK